MRVEWLGERAVVIREVQGAPHLVAARLNELEAVEEAVASYETVGVFFRERIASLYAAFETVAKALEEPLPQEEATRTHVIPVCYEMGEDLLSTAQELRMAVEELAEIHSGQEYTCYAVGFSPGFAYLGYLDERISGMGRWGSPRARVPAGSVAMTGRQTAVYPSGTPGGWRLIGRTPLTLVDVADDYFPISAGDRVRFERIDEAEFERRQGDRL